MQTEQHQLVPADRKLVVRHNEGDVQDCFPSGHQIRRTFSGVDGHIALLQIVDCRVPNTETLVAEYLSEHVHSWMYLD